MSAHVGDARVHHLFDEVVAGREVIVDCWGLDLGLFCYVGKPRARIPFDAEDVSRGIEDPGPCPSRLRIAVLRSAGSRPGLSSHRSTIGSSQAMSFLGH